MSTQTVVALLIDERSRLDNAIKILSTPAMPTRRPGRPPRAAKLSNMPPEPTERKAHARTFTRAQRAAFGERMKKYWAKRRKAEGR